MSDPFVVATPTGARVRTRVVVDATDAEVLGTLGRHLGSLAGADLAARCREGRLDALGGAVSRRERKRCLTPQSSSRWAGAITRTSEDAWQLRRRNLETEAVSLRARIGNIDRHLKVPVGGRSGRTRGYPTQNERFHKQQRFQVLSARLAAVETSLARGRMSIVRAGGRLARARHNLEGAGLSETEWRAGWEAQRLFLTADGEADKAWGNETIRWNPDDSSLEIKLPAPLSHLANRPHGRYRLSCPVRFTHRGDEVAAQASSGALRYDISNDADKGRWYLDASWKLPTIHLSSLDELRQTAVLAVDLNADHLAACVLSPDGNPKGRPITVALDLAGVPTETRDGRLRSAISDLIRIARTQGCGAFVIEDLGFTQARAEGREHAGSRPARGRRGRAFRRLVAGIPTARFRDRLTQMAHNARLAVMAVDPAYTSRWGAQHWLGCLEERSPDASGHHAAAVVIGRRGLGQRARRREKCDSNRPEDRRERATDSAVGPTPTAIPAVGLSQPANRNPGDRRTTGHPRAGSKTRPARRPPPRNQAAQDRSGPPTGQDSLPLSV